MVFHWVWSETTGLKITDDTSTGLLLYILCKIDALIIDREDVDTNVLK